MTDNSSVRQVGLQIIQQATMHDQAGNLKEALKLYSIGLEALISTLKDEKNERLANTLKQRIIDYLNRAEEIKKIIEPKIETQSDGKKNQVKQPITSISLLSNLPSVPTTTPELESAISLTTSNVKTQNNNNIINSNINSQKNTNQIPFVNPSEIIEIQKDQSGIIFDNLFLKYFHGCRSVQIEDSNLKTRQQLQNLVLLCSIIVRGSNRTCKLIKVTTILDSTQNQQMTITEALSQLASSLMNYDTRLEWEFKLQIASNIIAIDNGTLIKLSRGLDIYKPLNSEYSIEALDYSLRLCNKCLIEITQSK
eukprot:TRINITY_DN2694_c0_g4_i1.p1 TRINITY_DN2694_c0_g4~~TRINITY_DN2694_c0_g4_i1.p1  ORF type:complete len:309 (-),score=110.61 TRINITY_DN2694_c0_g4_i1:81-1007(-)